MLAVLDVCSPALARNWAAFAGWLAAKNKWNWTRRPLAPSLYHDVFKLRDGRFESLFLQRRVFCEP
jgi:hypothetical protein